MSISVQEGNALAKRAMSSSTFVLTTPISGPRSRFREAMEEQAHRFGREPAFTLSACPLCDWSHEVADGLCPTCRCPLVRLSLGASGDASALMGRIREAVREHGQTTWTPLANLVVQACAEDFFYRPRSGFAKATEGLDEQAAIRAAVDMDIKATFAGHPVKIDRNIPTGVVRGVAPSAILADEMAKLGCVHV